MIADVVARRTDRGRVGRPTALLGAHRLLVNALGDEESRHLLEEFSVEPVGEPPHSDARPGLCRKSAARTTLRSARLVEIFRDDGGAGYGGMALLDQHRSRGFGIERQEFLASLPHALLDEARVKAEFAEREAHEARVRTERVMKQCDHCPP